tara:strand:- start:157 stop:402 length:246 start_codon:yes stop_codon:yes gene_type:complete
VPQIGGVNYRSAYTQILVLACSPPAKVPQGRFCAQRKRMSDRLLKRRWLGRMLGSDSHPNRFLSYHSFCMALSSKRFPEIR